MRQRQPQTGECDFCRRTVNDAGTDLFPVTKADPDAKGPPRRFACLLNKTCNELVTEAGYSR